MKMIGTIFFTIMSMNAIACEKNLDTFYRGTQGLKGFDLKTKLNKILSESHRTRSYNDLIDIYFVSDADKTYDGDGSIVDIYSENPKGKDPYTYWTRSQKCGQFRKEADCFNREHIFPQGTFHKKKPMRTDFFHVYPTDGSVNGKRGNYPFGEVLKPHWVSLNGSRLGKNTFGSYSGMSFEPIDEFKGDIARALLYFATRYENKIGGWHHAMLDGSKEQAYRGWFINLLYKWHKQDPVSEHELNRNDMGCQFQSSRNPYIDHPEWVELIWSSSLQIRH